MGFEWDDVKDAMNIKKHGLSFYEAQRAFADSRRIIVADSKHSSSEKRYFCIGKLADDRIVTVRFTKRSTTIRIIGAGCWRKGKRIYERRSIQ